MPHPRAAQLSTPGDLWLAGVELADLLADGGGVDDEKVADAVGQVLADRPHWRKTTAPSFDGGVRDTVPKGGSWNDVLKRR